MKSSRLLRRFRIDAPEQFRLGSRDCADIGSLDLDRDKGEELLARDITRLIELQRRFYADGRWAVLIVLQGMDASGKDGVVTHVMSGLNPQGVAVHPFKAPSAEELAHDFLWRAALRLPGRGQIGIFNRSHYEEVLAVRVRPELLQRQRLPPKLVGRKIWTERFKDIRAFERHLARNGTVVLKFFLNISREEQCRRLLARLEEPAKRWKFSISDVEDRKLWDKYMRAYEDMIRGTSRPNAPWFVVPADHKWFARLVISSVIVDAMEKLDLAFPAKPEASPAELKKAKEVLEQDKGRSQKAVSSRGVAKAKVVMAKAKKPT
jgi:PPK2 family polyphosphate:nucleotide phosphotransferase